MPRDRSRRRRPASNPRRRRVTSSVTDPSGVPARPPPTPARRASARSSAPPARRAAAQPRSRWPAAGRRRRHVAATPLRANGSPAGSSASGATRPPARPGRRGDQGAGLGEVLAGRLARQARCRPAACRVSASAAWDQHDHAGEPCAIGVVDLAGHPLAAPRPRPRRGTAGDLGLAASSSAISSARSSLWSLTASARTHDHREHAPRPRAIAAGCAARRGRAADQLPDREQRVEPTTATPAGGTERHEHERAQREEQERRLVDEHDQQTANSNRTPAGRRSRAPSGRRRGDRRPVADTRARPDTAATVPTAAPVGRSRRRGSWRAAHGGHHREVDLPEPEALVPRDARLAFAIGLVRTRRGGHASRSVNRHSSNPPMHQAARTSAMRPCSHEPVISTLRIESGRNTDRRP